MPGFLDIDGSILEGGGQILRISMSLSAILGRAVRVFNIRANRSKPGLAAQHLKGIQLVSQICQGRLTGASIGSTEIKFVPGRIVGGNYIADIQTAGAISLLLQVALPVALLGDSSVMLDLRGGTNAQMAPQIDYMIHVFRPLLKRFGADFKLNLKRRGYFPRGGGLVTVDISPVQSFNNVSLTERGNIAYVTGTSFVAGSLPIKMAEEMATGAKEELRGVYDNVQIKCCKEDSGARDNFSGIIAWSELSSGCVLGADGLGRRGAEARAVGRGAGAGLRAALQAGACLDDYAQDQAILYMCLAAGRSSVRVADVTLHTRTAIHIAELLTNVKFDIRQEGETNIIECTGLGYVNKNLAPA